MATDFALMEEFCELLSGACLSQTRIAIDGHSAFGPVAILDVAIHEVPEIVVQRDQLGCLQRSNVVVPAASLLVVNVSGSIGQAPDLPGGQQFRSFPLGSFDKIAPAFLT
jgi:hypothetical protein